MRHRKDIHRRRSPPPHRRPGSYPHPVGSYRCDHGHRSDFLVYVDSAMPTCVILLATSSTGDQPEGGCPGPLHECGYHH